MIRPVQSLLAALAFLALAPPCGAQRICIDPGHSRKTVGTSGRKLAEYRICWTMATRLQKELQRRGYSVVLTKGSAEEYVSNSDRAEVANRAKAALFLRLHCDADTESGIATFYPAKQGALRGKKGPAEEVIRNSKERASALHHALIRSLKGALKDRRLRTDMQTSVGRKLGGALEGSIYSQVPVVLIEMCVLTRRDDEAFIASAKGQATLTTAMAEGVQAAVPLEAQHKP